MTNKIPEVGAKFRHAYTGEVVRIKKIKHYVHFEGEEIRNNEADIEWFNQNYEELPKPALPDHFVEANEKVGDEIGVAKERREEQTDSIEGCAYELKYELECIQNSEDMKINLKTCIEDLYQKKIYRLADKAQNLLNALDNQAPSKKYVEHLENQNKEMREAFEKWEKEQEFYKKRLEVLEGKTK